MCRLTDHMISYFGEAAARSMILSVNIPPESLPKVVMNMDLDRNSPYTSEAARNIINTIYCDVLDRWNMNMLERQEELVARLLEHVRWRAEDMTLFGELERERERVLLDLRRRGGDLQSGNLLAPEYVEIEERLAIAVSRAQPLPLQDDAVCVVCMERHRMIRFLPCECGNRIFVNGRGFCPICRANIAAIERVER